MPFIIPRILAMWKNSIQPRNFWFTRWITFGKLSPAFRRVSSRWMQTPFCIIPARRNRPISATTRLSLTRWDTRAGIRGDFGFQTQPQELYSESPKVAKGMQFVY